MIPFFFSLALFFTTAIGVSNAESPKSMSQIQWMTNYEEALKMARSQSKPMVLLFTGSDWCSWCIKLEEEALSSPDFASTAGDRFVFVKIDFPLNKTIAADITAANKQLQKRFGVTGFPTVVVLDPQSQKPIGTVGYRPGGGKQYALYLLKMLDEHGDYKRKLQNAETQPLSGLELRRLFEQASELGRHTDAHQIAMLGLGSDQRQYFLMERYRHIAEHGQLRSDEGLAIKQQLLAADPNNLQFTHYQIALIDFEASCRESSKEPSPDITVAALTDYIDKFGEHDKEHAWRVQMIVSQVYFENNRLTEALSYARSSYQSAPPVVQPEISIAIQNIQSRISNQKTALN